MLTQKTRTCTCIFKTHETRICDNMYMLRKSLIPGKTSILYVILKAQNMNKRTNRKTHRQENVINPCYN